MERKQKETWKKFYASQQAISRTSPILWVGTFRAYAQFPNQSKCIGKKIADRWRLKWNLSCRQNQYFSLGVEGLTVPRYPTSQIMATYPLPDLKGCFALRNYKNSKYTPDIYARCTGLCIQRRFRAETKTLVKYRSSPYAYHKQIANRKKEKRLNLKDLFLSSPTEDSASSASCFLPLIKEPRKWIFWSAHKSGAALSPRQFLSTLLLYTAQIHLLPQQGEIVAKKKPSRRSTATLVDVLPSPPPEPRVSILFSTYPLSFFPTRQWRKSSKWRRTTTARKKMFCGVFC